MPTSAIARAFSHEATPLLAVEVVTDLATLRALEPEWNALVARAEHDHPFIRHDWTMTWLEAFGDASGIHVVLFRYDNQLIGIAPMCVSRARQLGFRLRTLSFAYNSHTPRFDVIVDPRYCPEVFAAFWQYLSEHRFWDVLEFCQIPSDSPTLALLPSLARRDGFFVGQWAAPPSQCVSFQGTWTQYESTRLKRHHRTNTRSRLNRLKAAGEVKLEIVSTRDRLPQALEDGFTLEAAAWKGSAGTAMQAQDETRQFYTSLAERFAVAGLLHFVFLTLNGKRIAFAYGIRYRNKIYVLKTAYDPEHARNSPYNVLCYLLYQSSFEEGLTEYEFLGGSEDWKLNWSTHAKAHTWLYVFSPRMRSRLLHQLKFGVVPWAERSHPRLHRALLFVKTIFA